MYAIWNGCWKRWAAGLEPARPEYIDIQFKAESTYGDRVIAEQHPPTSDGRMYRIRLDGEEKGAGRCPDTVEPGCRLNSLQYCATKPAEILFAGVGHFFGFLHVPAWHGSRRSTCWSAGLFPGFSYPISGLPAIPVRFDIPTASAPIVRNALIQLRFHKRVLLRTGRCPGAAQCRVPIRFSVLR